MADKKVAITCEGFKIRKQDGNGFEAGELKDVPGLQEIELELEQGNEPVYADGVNKLSLFSGITGATLTATLMELSKAERTLLLGVKVEKESKCTHPIWYLLMCQQLGSIVVMMDHSFITV